jgi:hypothetical protein
MSASEDYRYGDRGAMCDEIDRLRALVDELADPDPCQYDHHDLCQAHRLDPRPCPHERAKHEWTGGELVAVLDRSLQRSAAQDCTCAPCASPQYGAPGVAHCAACCAGSLIEEYDDQCPIAAHRDMAARQYGRPETRGPG